MTPVPAQSSETQLPTLRGIADLRAQVAAWRAAGESIGLVPTMGGLHAGHLALVHQARAECDRVIATIFVNPIQFNEAADFKGYPREEARDAAELAAAGADLLFAPAQEEVYPPGFTTSVSVAGLSDCLCGLARPGHLSGVATVVAKLLLQSLPDVAYFGEKDYQQLLVVRRMARDLDIPVRIAVVPTVRAADGFALSSRNQHLTPEQRTRAAALYRVLSEVAERLAKGANAEAELARGRDLLLGAGIERIDYLELRHGETLEALERATPPARLFAAVWLGETRLIDNLAVV
jgi:pantoate--beta-alanine ligase